MPDNIDAQPRERLTTACAVVRARILQEAIDREWCSDYEEFVDGVNDELGWELLQGRQQPQAVHVTITFTVSTDWTKDGLTGQLAGTILDHAADYADSVDKLDVDIQTDAAS